MRVQATKKSKLFQGRLDNSEKGDTLSTDWIEHLTESNVISFRSRHPSVRKAGFKVYSAVDRVAIR